MNIKEKLLNTGDFIDNEYLDKYVELILNNTDTQFVPCTTNSHHIIPRYYYKHHKLSVDNSPQNRVNLLYRDHMLAHLYLSGCTEGRDRYWNLYSIFMMSGQRYCSEENLNLLEDLDEYQSLYKQAIAAAPNHRKGIKLSDETRAKMSQAQRSRESTVKGKVWVNKDATNKAIDARDLDTYLMEGWNKGRHIVLSEEARDKMDAARRKPRSEEFCRKMSEIASKQAPPSAEARKRQSEKMKAYYAENPNPFKGKKHTQDTLERNRKAHLGRKCINKEGIVKCVFPEDISTYLAEGWKLGKGVKKN